MTPDVNSVDRNNDCKVNTGNVLYELGINLENSDLSPIEKDQLQDFLARKRNTFAKDINELETANVPYHTIDTQNAHQIRQRFYRTSSTMKKEIDDQIEEMLKNDIIGNSNSSWASPVVMIKKRSSDYRFAVDYRKVNQVTRPISFSLPRVEDIFDTIGEAQAQIFTVLDLRSGFWQLPLDPKTKDRTAFTVHSGNFQFKKLPFGLKNAPMSFQMVMSQVLRGLTWKCALVYIDDILVYSKNFSSHLQHLEAIFDRLDNANLKLNPSKCAFATKRVTYLGHEIKTWC